MRLLPTAILPITAAIIAATITATVPATAVFAAPPTARVPVLLELFTSEGCSSCPPADRVLESLDHQPVPNAELIVLSEHVDYWNHLGWSDPYSSPFFSDRQQKYSARLASTVYTPQLVIDGQFQMVGSDQREVMEAIAQATQKTKFPVTIRASRSGSDATIHVDASSGGVKADLYIAIAFDHTQSRVLRGENGGHTLNRVAVVKSIVKIGKWEGGTAGKDVTIPAKQVGAAGETRVIAILQDPLTGKVLGVAQARI